LNKRFSGDPLNTITNTYWVPVEVGDSVGVGDLVALGGNIVDCVDVTTVSSPLSEPDCSSSSSSPLGAIEGDNDGEFIGETVGDVEGCGIVGKLVGDNDRDGLVVGNEVGNAVGKDVGFAVGSDVGFAVGNDVGKVVGCVDGANEIVGDTDGKLEGDVDGAFVGGVEGEAVGALVCRTYVCTVRPLDGSQPLRDLSGTNM